MQPVNVLVLLVAIILSILQGGTGYEIVGDLSALQSQYQTLLEQESTETTDTGIVTLLQKLDLLQHTPSPHFNVTLDWFSPPNEISTHSPLRITIVVSSFEGLFVNSGIGTFYSSLADFLVQQGHAVTILYTDISASDPPAYLRWKTQIEKRGLRAARLGAYPIHLRLSALAQRSYQVYQYLKNRQSEFDVVHFPDWEGAGYYSMLAKKDGIAFASKVFIVGIHGPWRWVKAANNPHAPSSSSLTSAEDMETDWMERKSVEMSDIAWTPSSDVVKWLEMQGWALPLATFKMAYLPGREITQVKTSTKDDDEYDNINEVVFFGRMETRKGLELFADALDRLALTRPEFAGTKITFLGKSADIGNRTATAYVDSRFVKGAWPFKVAYISHKDRKAALEYLRSPTRIAVMPSLVDNTPYTVYECLFSNIPFIASNISSIAAIIAPEDRSAILFETNAISLAKKLESVLDNGARIAKSSLQLKQIESSWQAFYARAHSMMNTQRKQIKEGPTTTLPRVSVCITHYNRPKFLQLALQSVEALSYANYEVVLIDDGSTTQEALEYLATLAPKFAQKGWQLIMSTNQYLGAARNKAAQHARGEYLLFLDDDNLLREKALNMYAEVALRTRADIVTAAHDVFEGKETDAEGRVVGRWVPLGASPLVGLFKNCFGDANFFIKKSAFHSLKGFTEDRGVGQEDHEFLAKAVLDGRSLAVIPEPLLAYRMHNKSEQMLYTTDSLRNALRAHRPYRSLMEESGIEITEKGLSTSAPTKSPDSLRLLAYSRAYSRQVSQECNMTVSSVMPKSFSAGTSVTLTITTSIHDCVLEAVRLGDSYPCALGTVQSNMFTCTTRPIPVPGNYAIFVLYKDKAVYNETSGRVIVTPNPTPSGDTTALATLAVYREAGLFDESELFGKLASIIPLAVDRFTMLSRTTTVPNSLKRDVSDTTNDEFHTMLISLTSSQPNAADAYAQIYKMLTNNPSVILPYRFYSILLNAICNAAGECSCGPNFVGVGCATPARCPNDCSGNGICNSGPNGKSCACNAGWTGRDCKTGQCPDNCNGRGTCSLELGGGNGTCACDSGWHGLGCETPNCPNKCSGYPCSTNGSCVCPAGINTPDCSIFGQEQTSDGKINTVDTRSKSDHRDRDIFIAVLVAFTVLVAAALAVLYVVRRKKEDADL